MIQEELAGAVLEAIKRAQEEGAIPELPAPTITMEMPRNKEHGDYACNVALSLAGPAKTAPRKLAETILQFLPGGIGFLERVEIAGAGFLNFYLKPDWLQDTLFEIEENQGRFGCSQVHAGEKVLIEFVSANPTGPISVVNGRAAALGDVLGNLLAAVGYQVAREYYINDALNSHQLEMLGETLAARYLQQLGKDVPLPPESYKGEYVSEMAKKIVEREGNAYENVPDSELFPLFRKLATDEMISQQRGDLESFGVCYDNWQRESALYEDGEVTQAIETIRRQGYAYEKDDAIWLKASALGDKEDWVLVRSNGRETYVAADAAYHKNKFDRGFTLLINIWGADHHGYVARLKAAIAALGYDPARCEVILHQMIHLVREGESVVGSKREGNVIPLRELITEVGRDAARFTFLLSSADATATFDLDLVKQQTNENPVYYVQYAHARIASILKKAADNELVLKAAAKVKRSLLTHPRELDLLRKLADFPNEVQVAAENRAPHRLTHYSIELASVFHNFYTECRVIGEEVELTLARLALIRGAEQVLKNALGLLGVSAPESM
ncbi:MAG: arginine--tRNA ligase [Armatimonadetes bacterium]|nr:arginine--tRNA ligase [Armatimonadota bacterium]